MSDYPMLISNKLHSFRNFLLHIANIHTHKLDMYTIYDISLHNIKITAILPFEKLEY